MGNFIYVISSLVIFKLSSDLVHHYDVMVFSLILKTETKSNLSCSLLIPYHDLLMRFRVVE